MKKLKISRRNQLIILIIALAISVTSVGIVFAQYIKTIRNETASVGAKKFYFESNYLTSDNHKYNLNADTESVTIELYNYENELRVSEVDATYTVTVESLDTDFTLNGERYSSDGVKITVKASEGRQKTNVVLGSLKSGESYKVSVRANGGYEKTLGAVFEVAPRQNGFYMSVDRSGEEYVILTVYTESITGAVNVSIPKGLIPDSTDVVLSNINNYENGSYVASSFTDEDSFKAPYSSRSYRFFKASDYENGDFEVKIGDASAEIKN